MFPWQPISNSVLKVRNGAGSVQLNFCHTGPVHNNKTDKIEALRLSSKAPAVIHNLQHYPDVP